MIRMVELIDSGNLIWYDRNQFLLTHTARLLQKQLQKKLRVEHLICRMLRNRKLRSIFRKILTIFHNFRNVATSTRQVRHATLSLRERCTASCKKEIASSRLSILTTREERNLHKTCNTMHFFRNGAKGRPFYFFYNFLAIFCCKTSYTVKCENCLGVVLQITIKVASCTSCSCSSWGV